MTWLRRAALALGMAAATAPALLGSAALAHPAAAPPDVIARLTARSSAVTDAAGQEWAAGAGQLGPGFKPSSLLDGKDVGGTTDDVLYQVSGYGNLSYAVPVPMPGTYRVRLLMAEGYWSAAGQRVFDVLGEGQPIHSGVDIVKAVGRGQAYELTATVPVVDGRLDLAFRKRVDNPLISAIEVRFDAPIDGGQGVTSFAARATAHAGAVTDAAGNSWAGRTGFINLTHTNSVYAGKDVAGTTDDVLYDTTAYGMTGFSTTVPAKARYTVRMLFMEPYWSQPGKRVFDVTAEGTTVLSDVDIVAAAGRVTAYQRSAVVTVTDGSLDLAFVKKIDNPIIAAVEVTYLDEHLYGEPLPGHTLEQFESRMTARGRDVTDSSGRVWQSRQVGFGSWNESNSLDGKDVLGTNDDVLYQVSGWDVKWYRLSVPAKATYNVRLLLTENYFQAPGQRVFDVKAEGVVKAAAVDVFAQVGYGSAYDVSFSVPVQDGILDLDFVNRANYANVAAIEVVSAGQVQIPVRPAGTDLPRAVTFAPDSFWTQPVDKAPLAENSSAVVANLAQQVADRYSGHAAFNAYEYNASFNVAGSDQAKVTVNYHDCQNKGGGAPTGLFDGPAHFVDVPVPDDAVAASGTDGAMTIYDPAADKLWEFWQMRRNATTRAWEACWGGRLDDVSAQPGYFTWPYGTSASGTAMAGGMITIEDVRRGDINHVMSLGVVDSQADPVVSWPAQRTDGNVTNLDVVMHGQRLRLDPSLDLTQYRLTPVGLLVAKAAQRYGFIVVDRAGVVGVGTESGKLAQARTGINPWDELLPGPPYLALRNFPWDKLQALPKDHGMPSGS